MGNYGIGVGNYVIAIRSTLGNSVIVHKLACEQHLAGRYHIEVVDLIDNPRLAADDQILAVPTLVKKLPPPIRTIVGDLSDTGRLLAALQLRARKAKST